MKSFIKVFSIVVILVFSIFHNSKESIADNKLKAGQVIPGIILVKFKPITKMADIIKLDQKYKTKTKLVASALNLYKVKLPATLNVEKAIKLYSNEKIVEYAEADRIMTIQKNKVISEKKLITGNVK